MHCEGDKYGTVNSGVMRNVFLNINSSCAFEYYFDKQIHAYYETGCLLCIDAFNNALINWNIIIYGILSSK